MLDDAKAQLLMHAGRTRYDWNVATHYSRTTSRGESKLQKARQEVRNRIKLARKKASDEQRR